MLKLLLILSLLNDCIFGEPYCESKHPLPWIETASTDSCTLGFYRLSLAIDLLTFLQLKIEMCHTHF